MNSLRTESGHDANFVVIGGTGGATSNDKVGIMATLGFPCYVSKMRL